ncbi:MAG: glutamate racemase [Saprospiraceae bacterium]|nr:glutamate racemase [Saprospiraceae bacterium]
MKADQPIGIFDSGIGGLTAANAILQHLPQENLIYFGDSLHFPYGEKTEESIRAYSIQISDFLLSAGCKSIVIACNSASASAFEAVKAHVGNRALVVDVITPTVYYIEKHLHDLKTVGVIGTRRTIESKAYELGLKAANPELQIKAMATPLLAPMIEEGFVADEVSRIVTKKYLNHPQLQHLDALILACTHYPLIKGDIEAYYNYQVDVLDTPTVIAEYIKDKLGAKGLLSTTPQPEHHFYVSKMTDTFQHTSQLFFSQPFQLQEHNIFED